MDSIPSLGAAPVDATPRESNQNGTSKLRQDREIECITPMAEGAQPAQTMGEAVETRRIDNRSGWIEKGQVDEDRPARGRSDQARHRNRRSEIWRRLSSLTESRDQFFAEDDEDVEL